MLDTNVLRHCEERSDEAIQTLRADWIVGVDGP